MDIEGSATGGDHEGGGYVSNPLERVRETPSQLPQRSGRNGRVAPGKNARDRVVDAGHPGGREFYTKAWDTIIASHRAVAFRDTPGRFGQAAGPD